MPSCSLRVSGTDQSCSPVFWSSAKASVGVAPKTLPSATTIPFGPSLGLFERRRPEHFAGVEVERLHVGGEVLRVDHALVDHRRRGVAAEVAGAGDRRFPGDREVADVGAVDRAFGVARVGGVDAGIAGAGEARRLRPPSSEEEPPQPASAATSSGDRQQPNCRPRGTRHPAPAAPSDPCLLRRRRDPMRLVYKCQVIRYLRP